MSVDSKWVALSLLRNVGGKTLTALLDTFDTTDNILCASEKDLQQVKGVGKVIAQAIRGIKLAQVEAQIADWQQSGVQIITWHDANYPQPFNDLADRPPTLFVRGTWESALWDKTVAIVGTRNPSPQMAGIAMGLATNLARQGYTIISGLAKGIDTQAHQGALLPDDGRTIGILGSGVLNIYPPENKPLADDIMLNGAILSEVHPKVETNSARLVSRNRLISGLSQAVIVVQTTVDGGAMYAGKRAFEQERLVYALDIPASGNQALIGQGATKIQLDEVNKFVLG